VRVSLVDSERGPIGAGTASIHCIEKKKDPDLRRSGMPIIWMRLVLAMRKALATAGVKGEQVAAIALDTTGSSVGSGGKRARALDDYYLWCDHRAWRERHRLRKWRAHAA